MEKTPPPHPKKMPPSNSVNNQSSMAVVDQMEPAKHENSKNLDKIHDRR